MKQKRGISRYLYTLLFLILAAAVVTVTGSCGGGGGAGDGGGGGGGGAPTPLATGSFTKTVEVTGTSWGAQFTSGFATIRYMHMYRAIDISGSGNITAIRFQYNSNLASAVTCPNTTIKLAHTNLANLTSTYANNVEQGAGSSVTVINNASVVIPAGTAGNYFDIPLSTSFHYNGVDNLVIEIRRASACSGAVSLRAQIGVGYVASTFSIVSDTAATGSTASDNISAAFVFAGGDNAPFAVGGSNNQVPFSSTAAIQRVQNLYLSSDIDGSGPITGVGIEIGALTTAQTYTVTVKLGHATATTLASNYDANYSGSPATVANAVTFSVPAGVPVGSYLWIPLTGTFNYNGTDNLLLELIVSSATGDTFFRNHNVAGNRLIYGPNDASVITPVGAIQHAKFRFNGGTMNFITAGTSPIIPPFDLVTGLMKTHFLYDAASLGTGGSISKIALRLNSNSVASDYSNFTVTIGQTSNNQLSGVLFANDFDASANVLSIATFSIPAGMLAGDWIEIPLSGTFSYDPTKNLVVEITTSAATAGNLVMAELNATRFPIHVSAATAPGATVPIAVGDYGVDMRFWVQKYN